MLPESDDLLDAVADAPVFAEAVEAHLDRYPLPVDEAEVARSVARLEARMGRRPARRPWGMGLALAAAAGLLALALWRLGPEPGEVVQPSPELGRAEVPRFDPRVQLTIREAGLELDSVGRTVRLGPEARVLSTQGERSAVLLVQEGEVEIGTTRVPEGHWALLTTLEDGASAEVVFPDGQAPPPLDADTWGGTSVEPQLERLRWQALPQRTLDALDRILEEP